MSETPNTPSPSADDSSTEKIKKALKHDLARRFQSDDLEIPMLPHIATQAIDLVGRPNVSAQELARLVEQDQIISARLIRIANSPVYRMLNEVTSLQRAIVTLGFRTVSDLIFSLAMESKIFRSKIFEKRMELLWEHSVGCAYICTRIAAVRGRDSENAFLFGLMHDIGKTLVLDTVAQLVKKNAALGSLLTPEILEDILTEFHGPVGGLMGRQWKFPDSLTSAIVFHHDPGQAGTSAESALLTAVGNLFCHQIGIGSAIETVDLVEHPWVRALGLAGETVKRLEDELPSATVLFISSFQSN